MATTTCVNGQTVVHKTSDGEVITCPDVCVTPTGATVVPIPYTNMAVSKDTSNGSKSVFIDGNPLMLKDSVFSKSSGGEPGIVGGIFSGTTDGVARFTNYSFDVKIEGRNVCRRLDPMISNNGNTRPSPLMQPNVEADAQEEKYPLSIAFEYLHPDVISGTVTQPVFQTLHSISGPETLKHERPGYVGALHQCNQPDGEYEVLFDEFDTEEESFE